tara:strand:+ start:225 stop:1355 length:1131 start_codon:yes stop_codon:yes gene_type:complete
MKKILLTALLFCFVVADEFFEPGVTIGGYGELHYTNSIDPDDDDAIASTKLDFHRWIMFVNYNWTPEWSLKSELEIEHNMIDGDGDYDGEVELEQAYVNYHNADGNWGYGAGVVLISAGIINETHEPPTFLSVERPSYNKYIIPTTWFGNGAMVYGSFGDIHAKFVLHEDMDGAGMLDGLAFGGLRGGRAKGYKSTAYHWTKNLAVHYTGMEGLNVGGSFTFGGAPTGLGAVDTEYVNWNLFEVHGQYEANNLVAAFEYGTVNFAHEADNMLVDEDGDGYGDTDLVLPDQVATGYYFHLGYDVSEMMGWEDCKLVPWFGMESYDMNDLDDDDAKTHTKMGLTWWPTDQVSWKIDYDMSDDNDSKKNTLSLGVGYMF